MLPPYGLPHRRPPTLLELLSIGFSIIFTLLLTHGHHTGATTSFLNMGLHPCGHHSLTLGLLAPIFTLSDTGLHPRGHHITRR
ncbi:hypothetical protein BJY52DRAFT_1316024, partial [Lactarius psammicola]